MSTAPPGAGDAKRDKEATVATPNPLDGAKDLQKMLVDYAKQETVEPIKTLGGYLKWGLAGSISMFFALFFLSLGTLRLLQSEFGFVGNSYKSFFAYLIALGVMVVAMVLLFLAFLRAKKRVLS